MDVTMVVTACDRVDLLAKTLDSFIKHNTYPIKTIIVRDDSGLEEVWQRTRFLLKSLYIAHEAKTTLQLLPPGQLGQAKSIDELMKYVHTPVVFHCEDDWEFTGDFLPPAMAVLDKEVAQVRGRHKDDHIEGVFKFTDEYEKNGVMVREVLDNHLFSWNPHVRLVDGQKFEGKNETILGKEVLGSGKKTLWLEEGYYRHIGYHKTTNRSGTPYSSGVQKA